MKEKRGFKAVTIFFVLALAVMSVLLVSMVLSSLSASSGWFRLCTLRPVLCQKSAPAVTPGRLKLYGICLLYTSDAADE